MLQYHIFLSLPASFDTQGAQACHPSSNLQKKTPQNSLGPNGAKYCFVLFLRTIQPSIELGIFRLTQMMPKPLRDHSFLLDVNMEISNIAFILLKIVALSAYHNS